MSGARAGSGKKVEGLPDTVAGAGGMRSSRSLQRMDVEQLRAVCAPEEHPGENDERGHAQGDFSSQQGMHEAGVVGEGRSSRNANETMHRSKSSPVLSSSTLLGAHGERDDHRAVLQVQGRAEEERGGSDEEEVESLLSTEEREGVSSEEVSRRNMPPSSSVIGSDAEEGGGEAARTTVTASPVKRRKSRWSMVGEVLSSPKARQDIAEPCSTSKLMRRDVRSQASSRTERGVSSVVKRRQSWLLSGKATVESAEGQATSTEKEAAQAGPQCSVTPDGVLHVSASCESSQTSPACRTPHRGANASNTSEQVKETYDAPSPDALLLPRDAEPSSEAFFADLESEAEPAMVCSRQGRMTRKASPTSFAPDSVQHGALAQTSDARVERTLAGEKVVDAREDCLPREQSNVPTTRARARKQVIGRDTATDASVGAASSEALRGGSGQSSSNVAQSQEGGEDAQETLSARETRTRRAASRSACTKRGARDAEGRQGRAGESTTEGSVPCAASRSADGPSRTRRAKAAAPAVDVCETGDGQGEGERIPPGAPSDVKTEEMLSVTAEGARTRSTRSRGVKSTLEAPKVGLSAHTKDARSSATHKPQSQPESQSQLASESQEVLAAQGEADNDEAKACARPRTRGKARAQQEELGSQTRSGTEMQNEAGSGSGASGNRKPCRSTRSTRNAKGAQSASDGGLEKPEVAVNASSNEAGKEERELQERTGTRRTTRARAAKA